MKTNIFYAYCNIRVRQYIFIVYPYTINTCTADRKKSSEKLKIQKINFHICTYATVNALNFLVTNRQKGKQKQS